MTTMSPELALVDPELRAYAVAGLRPVRPFSFLELRLLSIDEAPPTAPSFRASAAFAYLLLAIVRTFLFDALVFASVVACVLLANLFA